MRRGPAGGAPCCSEPAGIGLGEHVRLQAVGVTRLELDGQRRVGGREEGDSLGAVEGVRQGGRIPAALVDRAGGVVLLGPLPLPGIGAAGPASPAPRAGDLRRGGARAGEGAGGAGLAEGRARGRGARGLATGWGSAETPVFVSPYCPWIPTPLPAHRLVAITLGRARAIRRVESDLFSSFLGALQSPM